MDETEIQDEAARRAEEWGVGGYASSDGSGSEAERGQEGSDGSGDDDDEQQGTKKKKLKKKANKKEKKAKKEKLLSPLYLERLAAVKAKYGPDLYGELVWWEDQGTLEGERTQAKLDGIAELEVKARVAVAIWKAEVAKGGGRGGGGGGAGDREAGGPTSSSSSSSPRAASSLWFGGGTSKEIQVGMTSIIEGLLLVVVCIRLACVMPALLLFLPCCILDHFFLLFSLAFSCS